MTTPSSSAFERWLHKVYGGYLAGFLLFLGGLAALEQLGAPRTWIGFSFLVVTVLVYGGIGVMSRTTDAAEYYVAGRRVPALYNGMATGADWMSAASFIGMAGTLYLTGHAGLAFIMGWTGGYCLVAFLLAPYLRKFGQYTIPDFLSERYGGHIARLIGIAAAILCSFTYIVAQIYGVGLITARLTGLAFEIGIFVGLGGILVCSFLGGMRAVTWTQVAQYIVLIIAYMVPVVWLSVKQTGVPIPPLVYGQQLEKVSAKERELRQDPRELEVMAIFRQREEVAKAKLQDVPVALASDKALAEQQVLDVRASGASLAQIQAAERTLFALPSSHAEAERRFQLEAQQAQLRSKPLAGMPDHAAVFSGDPEGTPEAQAAFHESRLNFLALVFCLTLGTASLPHILVRYYTTPSVKAARRSVGWSFLFILLLYITAPALAVMVKYEVFTHLVGLPFDQLPAWIANWSKVDPSLLSVSDVNRDGIFQLGEMRIGGDIIVLATPEIAGLPYVVSAMVAAGGLAAALSTADGLLLTIANALSHDLYFKMIDPKASTARRVSISKALLLVVALLAAYVAAQKPADILFLVSAAFSFAASAFFPALVLGIFWKRTTSVGACLGMVSGLAVTVSYMATTQPWLRSFLGIHAPLELWWGIQPISAGVFGVPVGFAVTIVVSLFTPAPPARTLALIDAIRSPSNSPWERR